MHEKAIQAAGEALNASPLGDSPHVTNLWGAVSWKSLKAAAGTDAAVNTSFKEEINLYPGLAQLPPEKQQEALIREFGKLLYHKAGEETQDRWDKKLCLPQAAQIDAVQAALKKKDFPTYKDLVMSFRTLMDRFVATNVVNALSMVSHVHRENSRNIDIRTWGSTMDYCNCRRYHPLTAFVVAYGYPALDDDPGAGLAELVVYKMGRVREQSLAEALQRVIVGVFNACR